MGKLCFRVARAWINAKHDHPWLPSCPIWLLAKGLDHALGDMRVRVAFPDEARP